MNANAARAIVDSLLPWLAPHAERLDVAGSLRRGKANVKDVEIVVRNPAPGYYTALDEALASGRIAKARLGETGATRWGPKCRSIAYRGLTVELFTCDDDNAGYVLWLRTGPRDANQYLVTAIKYRCHSFRIDKGYLVSAGGARLRVATEADFFALCGLPYLAPNVRTEQAYRRLFGKGHVWGDPTPFLPPADLTPELLLDAPPASLMPDADRYDQLRAEAAYNARAIPRSYLRLARRALERGDMDEARRLVGRSAAARRFWGERTGDAHGHRH